MIGFLNAGMEVLEVIIDATWSRKKVLILRQTNLTIEKIRVSNGDNIHLSSFDDI